jgi:flagellar basal-body rod protein FlgB
MNALDSEFRFHETALKIGGQRQQVIASNMANADTPQFKASEVNFADALARATGETGATGANAKAVSRVTMVATRAGHIDGGAAQGSVVLSTSDLTQKKETQNAIDGNTVDLDAERAAFADNTVRYEASLTFLNSSIKTLMSAIQS